MRRTKRETGVAKRRDRRGNVGEEQVRKARSGSERLVVAVAIEGDDGELAVIGNDEGKYVVIEVNMWLPQISTTLKF